MVDVEAWNHKYELVVSLNGSKELLVKIPTVQFLKQEAKCNRSDWRLSSSLRSSTYKLYYLG